MNIDNNLILIKGEDKTASVTSWRFDLYKPVVFITFNGQKEYPYNTAYVEFLKDPKIVELDGRTIPVNKLKIILKNILPKFCLYIGEGANFLNKRDRLFCFSMTMLFSIEGSKRRFMGIGEEIF